MKGTKDFFEFFVKAIFVHLVVKFAATECASR